MRHVVSRGSKINLGVSTVSIVKIFKNPPLFENQKFENEKVCVYSVWASLCKFEDDRAYEAKVLPRSNSVRYRAT